MADPKKPVVRRAPNKSVFVLLAPGTDPSVIVGIATNPNDAMKVMEEKGTTAFKKFTIIAKPKGAKSA